MIRNKKKRDPIAIFLLISMGTHVAVFLYFMFEKGMQPQNVSQTVEVEYIQPPQPAAAAPDAPAKTEKLKTHALPLPKTRVVEQEKQINDEIDKTSTLLSKFNQKVEKETKAEMTGKFTNTAQSGKQEEGKKDGHKDRNDNELAKSNTKTKEHGELPDLRDLSPKYALNPGQKAPDVEPGEHSATDDYLKDVRSGLQTMLSTREFVYYTYYARIKEAIRNHWEPNVREKVKIIFRQGRTIASSKDRVTQVMVTLDKDGALMKVDVITQSGVEQLDSAAVQAFQQAAPFPNPPKGMVEKDGTIKIRWDFVLEV